MRRILSPFIFSVATMLFFGFFFVDTPPVAAALYEYVPKIDCGPKVVGKVHAIFLRSESDVYDTITGEPKYGKEACVLVPEGATSVKFKDIVKADLYLANWATNDACETVYKQISELAKDNPEGGYNYLWTECPIDSAAVSLNYKLKKTAPVSFLGKSQNGRIRYEIESQGGTNTFLFFVGMYAYTKEQLDNPMKALEEEQASCSVLVDGLDCEKNKDKCEQECKKTGICQFVAGECKSMAAISKEELVDKYIAENYKKPENYSGPLPDCVFDGSCRAVNDLVELAINVMKYLFTIIGSLALLAFVYGGFTMVVSMGNSEKFQKGRTTLGIAILGIIIAFSAYLLVDFMLDAFGVAEQFKGIK